MKSVDLAAENVQVDEERMTDWEVEYAECRFSSKSKSTVISSFVDILYIQ